MISWSTVYLIIGIIAGGLGVWNLARAGNPYLAIAGVLWFLVILFRFFVPNVWDAVLISGIPTFGGLLLYLALPVLLILASISLGSRR